ncbi:hypothetical protein AEA09_16280 [Lysinibacillus contaminans]|uniref:histidine kinase n=1 Tax=Lysinibacillus contaminans TaxID=1293441 RepID=A0ABR5JX90_9BACI|nr:ATP-binding protein [Lysinibacillus contaminans]KOS66797.1 hypothetical protein AEA09_16280 [Lysinibacillus contaminans]
MSEKKIFLILLFFFIVSHFYLVKVMVNPYIGISVSEIQGNTYTISHIDKVDGWAQYVNVSENDIILEIDGGFPSTDAIARGRSLKIMHNNTEQIITIPKNEIKISSIIQELFIPITFSILALLLSLLVIKNGFYGSLHFSILLLTTSISLFASTESGRGDLIATAIISFFLPLGSLFLMLFIYSLLYERKIILQQKTIWTQINIIFCCIITLLGLFNLLYTTSLSKYVGSIILGYFCLNIFYIVFLLGFLYFREKSSQGKLFIRWLLWINFFSFVPFALLHAFPYILRITYMNDDFVTLFLFIIPIGYFYLAVSKQLIDIHFILHQILHYILLSLVPVIIIVTFTLSSVIPGGNHFISYIVLITVVMSVFVGMLFVKEILDFKLRNYLKPRKDTLAFELESFIKKLPSCMKQDDVENLLIEQLEKTLVPSVIKKVYFNHTNNTFEKECIKENSERVLELEITEELMKTNRNDSLIEYREWLGIKVNTKERIDTFIWIGYKENDTVFNLHEKLWFINMMKYVRIVYENLHTVEHVIRSIENMQLKQEKTSTTLSRFLFQLSERERQRLASDLHDSVLQDQILWYRKLEHLLNEENGLSELNMKHLTHIKNGMLEVIYQTRSTCNALRPNLISDLGLIPALNELCYQMQQKVDFKVNYEFSYIQNDEFNLQICLYRVVQELLNNAQKHSKASSVSIYLWEDAKNIYLDYEDNGRGLDLSFSPSKTIHTGLAGIKERIYSLDGDIEFIPKVGMGFEVCITISK